MRVGTVEWARLRLVGSLLVVLTATGCVRPVSYTSPERYDRGYTAFLVGILGNRKHYNAFVDSLATGGVPCALEIVDWSLGPAMATVNMHAADRHRGAAHEVAQDIVAYQDRYPGRPVFLIGHSAGAGVVLLVLEELPPGRRVTGALLLGAAIDHDHNLAPALRHVERGIWNYWSTDDVMMLSMGTALVGNFGGTTHEAAGLVGFSVPPGLGSFERLLYSTRLKQVRFTPEMRQLENDGGHWGWLKREFAQRHICVLLEREGRMLPLPHSALDSRPAATR
jgi:pimeloyl-ACP methyl ester carboxylesterase